MTTTSDAAAPVQQDGVGATIDGVEVHVPKGTMIIRAAEQLGIAVPRFCDHPLLDPVAACRQCLVEVATPGPDGAMRPMPKPQPACAVELTEGMQVKTQLTSQVAEKAQHGVMELLLINHPLDCPVCDKGGECPLQNQAMSDGRSTSRFREAKRTFPKPIKISSAVLLDRERCIVCQRCTRFSKQISGDAFIDLQQRGAAQQVGTFSPGVLGIATLGEQMLDTSGVPFASYFSGNTIQICPVGALTSATYRFRSRPFDLVSVPGVCEQCACGCSQRTDHRRGVVLRRLAGNDPAVNEEWTCDKGRFAFASVSGPDRLERPMVRAHDGSLRPVSWPVALELAADGLRRALTDGYPSPSSEPGQDESPATGAAVLPGGQLRLEDAYAYSKFARTVLATDDIDHRARPHSAEEAAFLAARVAGTGLGVTYADLERAATVLLVGLEPEDEAPILFLRLRKAVRDHGTSVHALSPFRSRGLAKLDATWLATAPGTEAGVLDVLRTSHQARGVDADWVGEHRATVDALHAGGVLVLVGERLASSPGALTAVGALVDAVGARLAWVPRRAGERGALEAGALPGLLPGGRSSSDPAARAEVAALWGELPDEPGRDLNAILRAGAAGELGALVVGGLDLDDLPDPELAGRALTRTPFVVSLEVRASSVTAHADVVLPVAPARESRGSFVNWEGRRRPFAQVLDTSALSDTRVLAMLARALDADLGLRDVEDAAAELAELGRGTAPRPTPEPVPAAEPVRLTAGQAVLATWPLLLDAGRSQDGDPFLAGTAHRAHARMSAATAAALGVADAVQVRTARGALTVPLVLTDMPDFVIWLPTNSHGCRVRSLGLVAGDVVDVTAAPVAPASVNPVGPAERSTL